MVFSLVSSSNSTRKTRRLPSSTVEKEESRQEPTPNIRNFYAIERRIKDLGDDERYHIRQAESLPRLQAFKTWLDDNAAKVVRGSLTRKAMDYALNQCDTLVGYRERGDLQISNALAENAIRPSPILTGHFAEPAEPLG